MEVGQQCTAPDGVGNYCGFRATLVGLGVAGSDIEWEVTLLFSDVWRIQFRAFTETTLECQYPIRVSGSYWVPNGQPESFVTSKGLDLNITPTDYPNVTLRLDQVRIDPQHPICS